jgi:RNA-directed DNA polymerase
VALYVKRWLAAPLALPDGRLLKRDRGTPQGSAISPVLASLFMHYAFDTWMEQQFPSVAFERYADDVVVHCATERQAREVLAAIESRMAEVGLRPRPGQDPDRVLRGRKPAGSFEHTSFDFLGHAFRARGARGKDGRTRTSFLPAISKTALNKISQVVWSWRLHRKTGLDIGDIARRGQPHRAGMDAVLRGVLPLRDVSASPAHQRLPGAHAPQEAQTAEEPQESQGGMETPDQPIPPRLRPLGMDPRLLTTKVTRAG